MNLRASLLLLFILISACATPQGNPTLSELPPAAVQTASPTNTSTAITEAAITAESQRQRIPTEYDLNVQFDYANHSLQVHEEINYSNSSSDPINELQFIVEARRLGASFSLTDLQIINGPLLSEPEFFGEILFVPLQNPIMPGEVVQLEMEYQLVLPAGAGTLSWTDRQTNFIDWYPYIPAYINSRGWLIHEAAPVGEHEVFESANFKVHIEVSNAPASLQVAAAAAATVNGTTFDFVLKNARRFVWSASGQYEVRDIVFEDIPVTIYYFNEHRDAAKSSLDTAKKALEIYSDLFGAYPYESLAIVDAQFFDGMESDGLFFLDQSYFLQYNYSQRNYLTALTAHEVAHNWWFGQVGNDQALEPWLDEALCIYSELLYYENFYPEMVNWWWEFRIDRFQPEGWVDSNIYNHTGFDAYVQAVYMRGAQFLQSLRNAMGDEAFFVFLRDYSAKGTGQILNKDDFFTLLKDHSRVDLDQIILEYFQER